MPISLPVKSQRRLVQSKADEDVGHAQQEVQRCQDQARDNQAAHDAASAVLESGAALLAFELRRAQREPHIEQLVRAEWRPRRDLLQSGRWDAHTDAGEAPAHPPRTSAAK